MEDEEVRRLARTLKGEGQLVVFISYRTCITW